MEKKLLLLDAYALIYRAYYAFIKNPRINSKGFNTSAIYGFVNTLEEVLKREKPTHCAVGFDLPTPTFRHLMYEPYKANRPPSPEDIRKAVPYIREIIQAYNIPIIEKEGFEADDVIGTACKIAEQKGFKTYIMTSDKDYCQLVTENIFLLKPKRSGNEEELWGLDEVRKEFNITDSKQVIDVLAIWGDTSDNIPGIEGIGEKTSRELIGKFGNIEGIYKNFGLLKEKQKANFLKGKKQLELSRKLVTIELNVPIEFDEEKLAVKPINKEEITRLFEELEFRTILFRVLNSNQGIPSPTLPSQNQEVNNLFGEPNSNEKSNVKNKEKSLDWLQSQGSSLSNIYSVEHQYHVADTFEKRKELLSILEHSQEFCFDTETTGLDIFSSDLVGMSFAVKPHEAWYVPLPASRPDCQAIVEEFRNILENPYKRKIGQNIKFDILMLKNYQLEVYGELWDTMIAHYLIQPEQSHNMDSMSQSYLKYKPVSIEELIGAKGKNQSNMRQVPLEKIKEYACEDADVTLQLKYVLEKEIENHGLKQLFHEVEMPLVPVLADIERRGVSLHTGNLHKFSLSLAEEIITLEKDIIEMSGGTHFNLASPKQLGEILFDKMQIVKDAKKTGKSGQYSTNETDLAKLADKHPIIEKILEYRGLKKLLNTYVEALPALIHHKTGKIHTSFNQAIVSTGRLSSINPNLQNIPIKDDKGKEIRRAFIASNNDYLIASADYSQIELRIMAHLSEDENLIDAFKNELDVHTATASKIYGVEPDKVTKIQRSNAKSANFGIIYGISAFGLAENLRISRTEAKNLIENYFDSYPKVKSYMDQSIAKARESKYVTTIKGRRRYLPDIDSQNNIVKGVAERNAINAPIQGSAADIIKLAMINLHKRLRQGGYKSHIILQVHDELVFEIFKPELDEVKEIIRTEMENAVHLSIPLTVEVGVGENWLEAH